VSFVEQGMATSTENDTLVDFCDESLNMQPQQLTQNTVFFSGVEMVEIQLARFKCPFPATIWIATSVMEGNLVTDVTFFLSLSFHSGDFLLIMFSVISLVICPASGFVLLVVLLGSC